MNEFLEPILLKEEFIFNGTIDELNEKIRLQNGKKFQTECLDYNRFKFSAKWSLGTLIISGFPSLADGIKGFAKLERINENKTKVQLKTKVRIELYILLIIASLSIGITLLSNQEFSNWSLIYLPIGLLWLWFVYRVQEKMLFKKLRKCISDGEKTMYNNSSYEKPSSSSL